jgi:hypothetical protein
MARNSNLFINAASILAVATRQDIDGIPHLIVPVVAARVGVMNGLFYTEEALASEVELWNGTPVPVTHPKNGDAFLSANSPEGAKNNIGHFYHVNYDVQTKALKGQLYLNIPKAEQLGFTDLITRLEGGENIDVSTGLYPNIEEGGGEFNGESYTGRVNSLYPDHLAILPNETGACSVKKGCGTHIFTNCEKDKPCSCGGKSKPVGSIFSNAFNSVRKALGFKVNEASYSEIESKIRTTLRASLSSPDYWPYIMDVYDNFFVYELDNILFKQGYAMDATEVVTLIGDPIQVIIKREYAPVNPQLATNQNTITMKPHIIGILAGLLATNQITTADKTAVESLKPDLLDKLFPEPTANQAVTAPVVAPVANSGALTNEERELLNLLKANAANQKLALVEAVGKHYTGIPKDVVANMDLAALQGLASAIPGSPASNVVNFSGAAGAAQEVQTNAATDYVAPSILTRSGD